jgi:AbrB family looped-hinge helix DNA binding protein
MIYTAKVSTKGQVVIPQAIRQQLGTKPGTVVEFVLQDGSVVVRPIRTVEEMSGFLADKVKVKKRFTIEEEKEFVAMAIAEHVANKELI